MKTLITSIFLLLVVNFTASTQNTPEFQPFEKSYYAESLPCATLMPDGSLLYVYTQDTPVRSHHIRVRTPQGETLTKYTFTDAENPSPLQLDTTYQFRKILWDSDQQHYILVAEVTALEETNGLLVNMDANGNFISKSFVEFAHQYSRIQNATIDESGNISILGNWRNSLTSPVGGFGGFIKICSILGGDINNFESEPGGLGGLVQMPSGKYHLYVSTRKYLILNENLTINDTIEYDMTFSIEPIFRNSNPAEQEIPYFIGVHNLRNTFPSYETPAIYSVTENCTFEPVFVDDNPSNGNTIVYSYSNSFDYVNTSNMYLSVYPELNCYFYSDCENKIKLYSINSNGTLNWTRVLGGDASYEILQTIATPDLGCLLLVRRYDEDGGNWQEEDVYFVKFDKFGNVEPNWLATDVPTLGEDSGLQLLTVALSPNPATDIVQFSYPSFADATALSFTLYDAVGRQVLHQAQIRTQADLSRLPQGIYYYQIHHQGKPIQAGKLARQ